MRQFRFEAGGRVIEVSEDARALLDTLNAMKADLVSIASRLLDGAPAAVGDMHVCVSFASTGAAVSFLSQLIELAVASPSLRTSLTDQGHPRVTEIGARHLLWWPALRGQPLTMH